MIGFCFMKLILVRHGQTIENRDDIVQGQIPGRLTELGIEQAKKLALRLKNEKIDAIYSSDLARAADTAREIAKYHAYVPLEFVSDLRERDLGIFEEKPRAFLIEKTGATKTRDLPDIEGGESLDKLMERASNFLDKVLHKHSNDTVLFVAHSTLNMALFCVITNAASLEIPILKRIPNTAVSIFEINEDKSHKVLLLNSAEHLTD